MRIAPLAFIVGVSLLSTAAFNPAISAEKKGVAAKHSKNAAIRAKCLAWLNQTDPKHDVENHPDRVSACVANGGPPR